MGSKFVIARAQPHLSAIVAALLLVGCFQTAETRPDGSAGTIHPGSAESVLPAGDAVTGVLDGSSTLPPLFGGASSRPARGVWVLAEGSERVLEDPAKVPELVRWAVDLGISDLFVQVYRGGRAWYSADLADSTPYSETLARTGVDTLALLLEQAHAAGLRVHAWVNVLSLSHNRDAPILAALGPDAVLVDRRGRSLLDYPDLEVPAPDRGWYRMGTRGVYLDAGAPGVAERLTATFEELATRYPELDGLHLDYIRHPGALPFVPGSRFGVGLDFGYGAPSRERFRRETGLGGPFTAGGPEDSNLVNANAWDDWRRAKVTELVRSIRSATLAARPGLVISAAVNSYLDRAYLSLSQDWKRWLEEGLIDLAIPMAYTLDDRLLRYQLESFAAMPQAERIWSGLGVWLFARSPERALAQIEIARLAGIESEVLFSYDSIVSSPALLATLEEAARTELAGLQGAPAVSQAPSAEVAPGAQTDPP